MQRGRQSVASPYVAHLPKPIPEGEVPNPVPHGERSDLCWGGGENRLTPSGSVRVSMAHTQPAHDEGRGGLYGAKVERGDCSASCDTRGVHEVVVALAHDLRNTRGVWLV